jgi:hypothetical protein
VEEEPSEFQLCSKCKQSRFCSPQCFKAAWKPHHKLVCGTDEAEPRLPSQVAFAKAIEDMSRHMVQGIPWDPLAEIKRQYLT